MKIEKGELLISATDVAKHLACRYLTSLDLRAARVEIQRIYRHDPALAVLEERGLRHEAAYLSYLKDHGYDVLEDDSRLEDDARIHRTLGAMRSGIQVIPQAERF